MESYLLILIPFLGGFIGYFLGRFLSKEKPKLECGCVFDVNETYIANGHRWL